MSRRTEHHWPPNIPDLVCLDFNVWLQAVDKVMKLNPKPLNSSKISSANLLEASTEEEKS